MIRKEGYLLVDNRANGGGLEEAATSTCSHCQNVVVLNPDRTRPRNYCRSCDHYICDLCAGAAWRTLTCTPIAKTFDQAQERALLGLPVGDLTRG